MKLRLLFVVAGLLIVPAAFAQTTLTGTTSSSTNANQTASSQNEGVQATVNQSTSGQLQYGGHFTEDVKSQVPVSVVGYGSFSQSSCMTSVGAGLTTRVVSLVYNGPTPDVNCQHVVLGDAFGRATQLAKQTGSDDMARASLSMVFYTYCTSGLNGDQLLNACIKMKLVVPTGGTHKEGKVDVADVAPATILPNGAEKMLSDVAQGKATEVASVSTPKTDDNKVPFYLMNQQEEADAQAELGPAARSTH
jgi:hypothetical protein